MEVKHKIKPFLICDKYLCDVFHTLYKFYFINNKIGENCEIEQGTALQDCEQARNNRKKRGKIREKLADKPGSVRDLGPYDSHSSGRAITHTLKQPTRKLREPRQCFPIWSCSGWRLPRFTRSGAVSARLRLVSVALFIASRRPAVSRHPALRSPDFPLYVCEIRTATVWPASF